MMTLEQALEHVGGEVARAEAEHAPMHSAHEGYSVILEELDELWDEIKKKSSERDMELMGQEAVQVAAMAVRFLLNVVENAS